MVLIVCADSPLLQTAALRTMRRRAKNSALSLLCFRAANPRGYGRIVRGDDGKVAAIVEEKEADATQRGIDEVFAGALVAPRKWLTASLKKIVAGGKGLPFRKSGGEYYLTWLAALARREGMAVATVSAAEEEAAGINTMADLAAAEGVLRRRRAEELMRRGAQIADPMRLDIRGQVRGGRGAVIDVGVILAGTGVAGAGSENRRAFRGLRFCHWRGGGNLAVLSSARRDGRRAMSDWAVCPSSSGGEYRQRNAGGQFCGNQKQRVGRESPRESSRLFGRRRHWRGGEYRRGSDYLQL